MPNVQHVKVITVHTQPCTAMPSDSSRERDRRSADDLALFREAVQDVRRLDAPVRVDARTAPPKPYPYLTEADEAEVMEQLLDDELDPADMESGEELVYRRDGLQLSVIRRLRRGHYRVGAELDLHGMIVVEARAAVSAFIADARAGNRRCVRIIHGKGLRSRNRGPVLKMHLAKWLRRRDDVLAFCSARPIDGGTGAVYVLLRR